MMINVINPVTLYVRVRACQPAGPRARAHVSLLMISIVHQQPFLYTPLSRVRVISHMHGRYQNANSFSAVVSPPER